MTNRTNDTDVLDAAGAAALLHMGVKKLYALINDGSVPALKLGNRFLLSRDELLKMVASGRADHAAGADEADRTTDSRS